MPLPTLKWKETKQPSMLDLAKEHIAACKDCQQTVKNSPEQKKLTLKPQKYQCWKCEGKKYFTRLKWNSEPPIWDRNDCSNCNGKGYIELIPYQS